MLPRWSSSGSPSPGSWGTNSDRPDQEDRRGAGRRAGRGRDQLRRADPRPPRPDRRRRWCRARVPAGGHRRRAGSGGRLRRAARRRHPRERPGRGADRGQGRAGHAWAAHHVRVADPRGLGAAVRRHRGHQAPRRGPADPRQDQHGRVRDGLVDRALGVRALPQPVGPRPDPGRLRRWLGGRGRGLRGAAGARHRHRRLDPPAGCRHRDHRREADVRLGLPLRAGRPGQLPRPGRAGDAHGAGRCSCCTRSSAATTRWTRRRSRTGCPTSPTPRGWARAAT